MLCTAASETRSQVGEEEEEEEIIRCVCNIFRDEGLMIQCDKCEVSHYPHYLLVMCPQYVMTNQLTTFGKEL